RSWGASATSCAVFSGSMPARGEMWRKTSSQRLRPAPSGRVSGNELPLDLQHGRRLPCPRICPDMRGNRPSMVSAPSFQELILRLQTYWSEQGCVILQPYDMEVGAGTFHPATTLRALGPKPWSAAYVQPSRR